MNKAKELADAHWEYIEELLHTHTPEDTEGIKMVRFHYISAFIHGYKHAVEDFNSNIIASNEFMEKLNR